MRMPKLCSRLTLAATLFCLAAEPVCAVPPSGGMGPGLDQLNRGGQTGPASARTEELERKGFTLLQQSKFADAESSLREAVRLDPKRLTAHSMLGVALLVQNKLAPAEAEFRTVLQERPRDVAANYYMGWVKRAQGDIGGAVQRFRTHLRLRQPGAARFEGTHVILAQLLTVQKDFKGAADLLIPVLPAASKDPTVVMGHLILISALTELGRFSDAKERLDALKRSTPSPQVKIAEAALARAQKAPARARTLLNQALKDDAALASVVYYELARTEMVDGKGAAAATNLELAISKAAPQDLPVLLRDLSSVLVQNRQTPRAIQILTTAADRHPDQPWIRFMVAELQVLQGNLQAGQSLLNQVTRSHPDFAPAHYLSGVLNWNANRRIEARRSFERAIQLAPGDVPSWLALAGSYEKESPGQSQAVFDRALKANADHPALLYQSAILNYEAGQFDAANAKYRKILANDPNDLAAMNNLALSLAEKKQTLPEALRLAQQVRNRAGGDPSVEDTYGWILFLSGNAKAALPLLEAAAAKSPQDGLLQYHLGSVYVDQRKPADGKAHLLKASQLGVPAFLAMDLKTALQRAK